MKLWSIYYTTDMDEDLYFIPIEVSDEVVMYSSEDLEAFELKIVDYVESQWPDSEIVTSKKHILQVMEILFTKGIK